MVGSLHPLGDKRKHGSRLKVRSKNYEGRGKNHKLYQFDQVIVQLRPELKFGLNTESPFGTGLLHWLLTKLIRY